MIDDILLTAIV